MPVQEKTAVISAIRGDIEQAADQILSEAEICLRQMNAAREGDAGALDALELGLTRILEACAFQDIVGQRLSQLAGEAGYSAAPSQASDTLLNGPARAGEGLDQSAIDRLMQTSPPACLDQLGSQIRSMLKSAGRMDFRKSDVLVVDDNQHSLDLLSQVLVGFRFRSIQSVRSAKEAEALVASQPFDLIILDAEMPGQDGFEFAMAIRGQAKGPNFSSPIIVVSSFTPLQKVMQARDAGANLVVKKPISASTLASRIEWIARSSRPFVQAEGYCGPDRRFRRGPLPDGAVERRADALALAATPDRALSQDDIDSLFG